MGNFSIFNLFYICFKLCLELNAIIISPAIVTQQNISKRKKFKFSFNIFNRIFALSLEGGSVI